MRGLFAGVVVLGMGLGIAAAQAQPAGCRFPDDLALTGIDLPVSRRSVQAHRALTILAVGGASTAGTAAQGEEYSYPSRLAVHLRAALPGVAITVVNRAQPAGTARARAARLDSDLAELKPSLVIWAPGSTEAGASDSIDSFAASLEDGVDKVQAAGSDLLLIDLQYAPSLARVINLSLYNAAISDAASAYDVPLLHRSALMQRWNDDGVFDLDHTPRAQMLSTIRRLFDCLATGIAEGVTAAVSGPAP